jgi:hypothetical protein
MDLIERSADIASVDQPILLVDDKSGELSLNYTGEDPLVIRAKITELKERLLAMPGDHIEMPVEHAFANGMYMRKLFIPKGTLLIGKIHRQECINIVAKGDISVLTETGAMRVSAGFTIVSPAGIQKVGLAHEDTVFINIFLTNETDVEKIEDVVACESYDAIENNVVAPLKIEGVEICQ